MPVTKARDAEDKRLERMLRNNLSFIEQLAGFTQSLAKERGTETTEEQPDGRMVVHEVEDFNGFKFRFGENAATGVKAIRIWRHSRKFDAEPASASELKFDFSWRTFDEPPIELDLREDRWLGEIVATIRNRRKICQAIDAAKDAEERREKKKNELHEAARRAAEKVRKQEEARERNRREIMERARAFKIKL